MKVPKINQDILILIMSYQQENPKAPRPKFKPVLDTIYEEDEEMPYVEPEIIARWQYLHRDFTTVGKAYETPWEEESQYAELYTTILSSFGYKLDWDSYIYKADDGDFDHSVWKVTKFDPNVNQEVSYALKVVSLMYYKQKLGKYKANFAMITEATLKEAKILVKLNHPGIVRTFDYIQLPDPETDFPFVYIAIVMEYMDGNLQSLLGQCGGRGVKLDFCWVWFTQIARALEYLHHDIRGPDGFSLVVAHMAITPRNFLYKVLEPGNFKRVLFKLSDFEECNIFDRSGVPEQLQGQFDQDFVKSYRGRPYVHLLSAPEFDGRVIQYVCPWQFRHARPTDIYSLGMSLAVALVGDTVYADDLISNITPSSEPHLLLIKAMTERDPDQRPTIRQVLQNEWVIGGGQNQPDT